MLKMLSELFNNRSNDNKQDLTAELVEEITVFDSNNNLKDFLDEQEAYFVLLICQLFSYRLVVRANDITISYSLLDTTYDRLVEKLKKEYQVNKDIKEIKEEVDKLFEIYKSANLDQIVKIIVELLVASQDANNPIIKGEVKTTICQYITLIQDYFIFKTRK